MRIRSARPRRLVPALLLAGMILSISVPSSATTTTAPDGHNLLSAMQASFEGNASIGWVPQGNTVVSVTDVVAHDGRRSLAVTADRRARPSDGSGIARVGTTTDSGQGIAVQGGQAYAARVQVGYTANVPARCEIRWFDRFGRTLATDDGAIVRLTPRNWTQLTCAGTAPADAVSAGLRVAVAEIGFGSTYYVDDAWFVRSTVSTDVDLPAAPPPASGPEPEPDPEPVLRDPVEVTVAVVGQGAVVLSPDARVERGTRVTATATPAAGSEFVGWTAGGTNLGTANPITEAVLADVKVTATFRVTSSPATPPPTTSPGTWPTGATTGVPAGTSLTDVGYVQTTRDGQVIERVRASGVEVRHSNVTIRNSRIDSTGTYGVFIPHSLRDRVSGLLIEDTELVGVAGQRSAGIAPFGSWTARRIEIRGFEDGVKVGSNQLLEDSWIHSLYAPPGAHVDGVQSVGGRNVTIRNNRIEGPWRGQTSALIIQSDVTSVVDYRIEGNLLSGGAYTVYLRDKGNGHGAPRDLVVTDNVVVRDSYQFGPTSIDRGTGWTVRGNTYDDGSPLG